MKYKFTKIEKPDQEKEPVSSTCASPGTPALGSGGAATGQTVPS